jgi:hypothetical protein
MVRLAFWCSFTAVGLTYFAGDGRAQPPPASKSNAAPAPKMEVHASLAQLMRGILYPSSNVVFAAQSDDPAQIKPAQSPSMSPNLLTSTYGQWQAVENSSLAIVETANLLLLPGRKCSNGVDVPIRNPDWGKFVQELRLAGLAAYKAAQSKNQDNIVTAADPLTTACSNCHEKYREKPTPAERCK